MASFVYSRAESGGSNKIVFLLDNKTHGFSNSGNYIFTQELKEVLHSTTWDYIMNLSTETTIRKTPMLNYYIMKSNRQDFHSTSFNWSNYRRHFLVLKLGHPRFFTHLRR